MLNRPENRLWAIADGMGGLGSGDIAAQIAVDSLSRLLNEDTPLGARAIMRALGSANDAIRADPQIGNGCGGTTIAAAWADGDQLQLFWAGDSRIYRIRQGRLHQLTRDHSVVQEMIDAGIIEAADAEKHPRSNLITRALGAADKVAIERATFPLMSGDKILLCSDGVSRSLAPRVPTSTELDGLADTLLEQALQKDGSDNASLILVAFP